MNIKSFMSGVPFRDELLKTAVQVVRMDGAPLPCTITFMTAAGNVKIRTSPEAAFTQPKYDTDLTIAGQIVVTLTAGIYDVQFTGVAGTDRLRVQ